MIEKKVARRWGNALFAIATENNHVGEWQAELSLLSSTIEENAQLKQLINGKNLTAQAKKETLEKLFVGQVNATLLDFFSLLIDKGREDYFPAIKVSFDELVDEAAGITSVAVTAAYDLSAAEEQSLAETLTGLTKQKVRLAVNVDKSIIGGLKVQIGDIVYDGSITQQLVSLRKQLSN